MEYVLEKFPSQLSQRRACRVLGQSRSTQYFQARIFPEEEGLINRMITLACSYGRYGYRRITALLRAEGWQVNHKRVERLWRQKGLKVPQRQPRRKRLWFNDGSCLRLRPERPDHVWSYDFVTDRTHDGRSFRILTVMDEYSRECLAIEVAREFSSINVLECLGDLFVLRGTPGYLRSDNGSEFTAKLVRGWLDRLQVKTLFIEPGSPWENGYIESFNGKLRDEFLNGEIFETLQEAKVLIESWRRDYNRHRPHSFLGYKPPAPEAWSSLATSFATLRSLQGGLTLT